MRSRMDMTSGSLGDKIIKYAIPLAATGILQQLFNAADLAVVGQFSGKAAMAAVGGNAPVIGLLVNLFVGISRFLYSGGLLGHRHMRRAAHLDIYGLPARAVLRNHYAGLSAQPGYHGRRHSGRDADREAVAEVFRGGRRPFPFQ